jgi:hypothetical protein
MSCATCEKAFTFPPTRSTFCFDVSGVRFKTWTEINDLKRQWNTFERIENLNSGILKNQASFVPGRLGTFETSVFVRPADDAEKSDYLKGQLAHIARYPDISDFLVPYASRTIPYSKSTVSYSYPVTSTYTSTLYNPVVSTAFLSTLFSYPITSSFTSTLVSSPISSIYSLIRALPPNPTIGPPNQLIPVSVPLSKYVEDKKARSLFITVSTFTAKFPKSPYKFASSDEYVLYKRYRDTIGHG